MINLSYRFDQNSTSLELAGMPDVSNGDTKDTIGIISSWTLKIIGSPQLEGEKEHLDNLMQAILQYSRSYISGIQKTFISNNKIVKISPFGISHKLLLNSTKKDVKPLEIILDDSELSDLTRCLDLLIFDPRFNIKWDINKERPFSKKYIRSSSINSSKKSNFFYALIIFLFTNTLLVFIPTNNKLDLRESVNSTEVLSNKTK
ncbi:DUF4335 domain-containing protein [Prochlorococcus sp. MIT 1011]|uniref:DUF4335 domain-containing protein n=1 Tax=Prochlorococcus sp. MIT 1011 TaxID=3082520 RepID=UPI0039B686C2